MNDQSERAPWDRSGAAALAGFALFLFLPGIILRDFWLYNEGRRAIVAFEMVERHDWIVPRLMGMPLLTKPPLFYWLEAIAYKLTGGATDWAARMPSLISAILGVLALHRILQTVVGRSAARMGGAVLALSPIYLWMAQTAEPEMVFTVGSVGALLCFVEIAFAGRRGLGWKIGLYAFAGLSFFTKGPVVPLTILLTIAVWIALMRRGDLIRELFWVPGIAIFAGPTLIWALLLLNAGYGPGAFKDELAKHLGDDAPHKESFFFFWSDLKALLFPWPLVPAAALGAFFYRGVRERRSISRGLGLWDYLCAEGGGRMLVALWFLVTLLVLSVIPSKRYYYAVPLAPPLAALVGIAFQDWQREDGISWPIKTNKLAAALLAFVAAGLLIGGLMKTETDLLRAFSGKSQPQMKMLLLLGAAWTVGVATLFWRQAPTRRWLLPWTVVCMAAFATVYNFAIHPRMNRWQSLRIPAEEIRAKMPEGTPLFATSEHHTIWFYLRRTSIPEIKRPEEIRKFVKEHPGALAFTDREHLKTLKAAGECEIVYASETVPVESEKIYLVKVKP